MRPFSGEEEEKGDWTGQEEKVKWHCCRGGDHRKKELCSSGKKDFFGKTGNNMQNDAKMQNNCKNVSNSFLINLFGQLNLIQHNSAHKESLIQIFLELQEYPARIYLKVEKGAAPVAK